MNKLYIKEIAWGIDRKNGGSSEQITAEEYFPCEVGAVPQFGMGRRKFFIDEATDSAVTLSVRYENNPTANKSWVLKKNIKQRYMPRSFDGGYKYEFCLMAEEEL